jgi:transposase
MDSNQYVGIDVSKAFFDVAIEAQGKYHYYKFDNNETGFKGLRKLLEVQKAWIAMEASGPYYLQLASYLYENKLSVSVINPLVIRRFCQMRLSRTKTDRKDAMMIAAYLKTEQPSLWQPEKEYVHQIKHMQAAMDLLNKHNTGITNQLEALQCGGIVCKEAVRAMKKTKRCIENELARLEDKMQQLITTHHGAMYTQLQSIPGLGKKTSLLLIAISGAFTKFNSSRQLSAYIGLCPRIFESGSSVKGKARITKMGMSRIRAMLYVCAWSAKRCNKACRELYERLLAKGKAKKQALIAVANKLLKQAFSIATKNTLYNENYLKNTCF